MVATQVATAAWDVYDGAALRFSVTVDSSGNVHYDEQDSGYTVADRVDHVNAALRVN